MNTCTKTQLLQIYDAVLDAAYHQTTLYGAMLKFSDDIEAINQAHAGLERNYELMLATRKMLDGHILERGCDGTVPPGAPTRFTEDSP